MNPAAGKAPGSDRVDTGSVPRDIFPKPIDRAREAVFQCHTRFPAQDRPCSGVFSDQTLDLASGGAQARLFGLDLDITSGQLSNQPRKVANADLSPGTEVDRSTNRPVH